MRKLLFLSSIFYSIGAFCQPGVPAPTGSSAQTPDWGYSTKALGDSCGAYFNNYVGLAKTGSVLQEYLRTGDAVDYWYYAGRAQRFTVSQPTEVSGIEFYAYETSPLDSVMVITTLNDYNPVTDSLGAELARDTVYVKHTAFTLVLPNISVKSYFDNPVVVTDDYMITMFTPLNEELVICTNDYSNNEGDGEGNSFALYQNPDYPADDAWTNALTDPFILADYDYLMSPLVKFDLFEPFTILDDTICPDVPLDGCVEYTQQGNFTNHMYNSAHASSTSHIAWLWGDGYQNVDITSACHTYANPGTFDISIVDTLFRYNYGASHCRVNTSQPIVVLDLPVPSFTFTQDGLTANFVNTSTNYDSLWWDFGDASTGSNSETPSHNYTTVSSFEVWLHAYNECSEDSTMLIVTTDDLGIGDATSELIIYPNPAQNFVTVSGIPSDTPIELYNLLGERVYVTTSKTNQESIPVAQFATGTYFLKIGSTTHKLIVKH